MWPCGSECALVGGSGSQWGWAFKSEKFRSVLCQLPAEKDIELSHSPGPCLPACYHFSCNANNRLNL